MALPRVEVPSACRVCDGPLTIGGPIWNKPIHNVDFCKRLMQVVRDQKEVKLGTSKRIQGILTGIVDEQPLEHIPLNYDFNYLCSNLKTPNPDKRAFVYAMRQLGYNAVQTYYNSALWKTDAPPEVLYDVFKVFKTQLYKNDQEKILANLSANAPGRRIFEKPLLHPELSFDYKEAKQEAHPAFKAK